MSIQPIDSGRTRGLQIRVFRDRKVMTRFLAFRKHGGEEATWGMARQIEAEMELAAGAASPCRKKGLHAAQPNRNTSTGIPGVRAFILQRDGQRPVLQFSASWRSGPPHQRLTSGIQRSSEEHGILGALGQVLAAREEGSGIPMPTARQAWLRIKKTLML